MTGPNFAPAAVVRVDRLLPCFCVGKLWGVYCGVFAVLDTVTQTTVFNTVALSADQLCS